MTNKEQEVLIRLVESLNRGNSSSADVRVSDALKQLKQLKASGCDFDIQDRFIRN